MLVKNADVSVEKFALLFEFTGDVNAICHVPYCCSASRSTMEDDTKEDENEVKTGMLCLIAVALVNGYVKVKTSANTSDEVYNS